MSRAKLALQPLALIVGGTLLLSSCMTGVPKGVQPVEGFQPDRYLGKWYEIARLDHSFERGLTNVTAEYSLKENGDIQVVNRGWNEKKEEWSEARATAKFQGDRDTGSLKVSFFWPFYGGYHVIKLDKEDYEWALVSGPDKGYLWILARDTEIDKKLKDELLSFAEDKGYEIEDLIWVDHDLVEGWGEN